MTKYSRIADVWDCRESTYRSYRSTKSKTDLIIRLSRVQVSTARTVVESAQNQLSAIHEERLRGRV